MRRIKATIIDDERDSRKIIRQYLEEKFPSIYIISEAHSVKSALESISLHPPDLLFLDIQLPDGKGFEVLEKLERYDFNIIFITAYEQYAINAIKHYALDYILKPIDREEFNLAIDKYLEKETNSKDVKQLIDRLLNKLQQVQITLPTLTGFKVVNVEEIIRLKSEGGYTQIFFLNGKVVLASKNLKEYEKTLPKSLFCRIHHSHIINVNYMREYIKGRGGQVVLQDGSTLSVSQNRKRELLKFWR